MIDGVEGLERGSKHIGHDIFAQLHLLLGMGTRRPETLQLRSRDFLYITQPCINIGRLII